MSVLIIGAASGLGRVWARRLLAQGESVHLADLNPALLADLAAPDSHKHAVDVTDYAAVQGLFAHIQPEALSRVITTAGIMPTSLVADDNVQRITKVMQVNYLGVVHVIQAALPHLQSGSQIVVFGSVSAEAPTPHMSAYAASKAAVSSYVEIAARELARSGIAIHLVLPPMTDTPLIDQARKTSNPRSFEVGFERDIAAAPEDIIAQTESQIARGKTKIYPHYMAKALHWAGRLTPGMLAWAIDRAERS